MNHFFHVYNTLIFRILVFVTISMIYRLFNEYPLFKITHDYYLETGWTATPRALVVAVTYPSIWLLYWIERPRMGSCCTVIGNQWYWIYRNAKLFRHNSKYYDSIYAERKLTSTAINRGEKMFMITSNDVIHNWRIAGCYRSSLRMKMDAYPRRLNVAFIDGARLKSKKQAMYLRYCSELCRIYHAYMPISVVVER